MIKVTGHWSSFRWLVSASMLPSIPSYLDNWRVKKNNLILKEENLLYPHHHNHNRHRSGSRLSSSTGSSSSSSATTGHSSMARTNSSKLSLRNWPNSSEFIRWNSIQNIKNRLSTWRAVTMVCKDFLYAMSPSLPSLSLSL